MGIPFGIVLSAVKLAWKVTDVFNAELLTETAENIFSSVYTAYLVVFYYIFFRAIAKIDEETDLPSIQRMAYADILLSAVFLIVSRICYALVAFAPELLGVYKAQVLATAMLLPIIVMLLCFVLVFRCYMRICLEGDEDMEEKQSSFRSPVEFYENDKYKKKNKKK